MAIRPFAFGVRMRDKSHTVRVIQTQSPKGYVVQDTDTKRKPRTRKHATLEGAMKDVASLWRSRLN